MKKLLIILLIFLGVQSVIGQNNSLVINGAYVKLNNGTQSTPIYLVVNQSDPLGINVSGGGHIISESEYNLVKWNTGITIGSFTIPYGYSTTDYLPLTVNKTSNGSPVNGFLLSSTYSTASDNLPWSEDVTNMNNIAGGAGELYVLDRWWIVDASSYSTTKPNVDLTFTYRESEEYDAPNIISESSLQAQQWDSDANGWKAPSGTQSGSQVTTSITGSNFFRNWVLSDIVLPLPIDLIHFSTLCDGSTTKIEWETSSELNNDFFTLEKTVDGIHFEPVTQIQGAGNSTLMHYYSYEDHFSSEEMYYRLTQTDYDGNTTKSELIASKKCFQNDPHITIYPNPSSGKVMFEYLNKNNDFISAKIVDMLGNNIENSNQAKDFFDLSDMAEGVYFLQLYLLNQDLIEKIVISK